MNDRYGEAQTLWGRARTHASQATPDWTAALADLDRAIELFEAMETEPRLPARSTAAATKRPTPIAGRAT